jgi:hypothetical protein
VDAVARFVARRGPLFEARLRASAAAGAVDYPFLLAGGRDHAYYCWRVWAALAEAQRGPTGADANAHTPTPTQPVADGPLFVPPPAAARPSPARDLLRAAVQRQAAQLLADDHAKPPGAAEPLSARGAAAVRASLSALSVSRARVEDACVACVEHAYAAHAVVDLLLHEMERGEGGPRGELQLARLYLLSDLLHCSNASRAPDADKYAQAIRPSLPRALRAMGRVLASQPSKLAHGGLRAQVVAVLDVWRGWGAVADFSGLVELLDQPDNGNKL